jgi:hypothetical protein
VVRRGLSAARPFLALVALGAAIHGCNLIIGLEHGIREGSGGGTSTSSSSSSSGVCTPGDGGTGDACDRSWARWSMTKPPAYAEHGNGTVTDLVSGLMWEKAPSKTWFSWADAKTHCQDLRLGDYCDWRLPTRIELASILDYGTAKSPMVDPAHFEAESTGYWTASPLVGEEGVKAWWINFDQGLVIHDGSVDLALAVRCVR